jgi:hypothetical protein
MCDFATDATEDATLEGHHVSTTPADAPNVRIRKSDTAENCITPIIELNPKVSCFRKNI